jgi:hypothetical protein
MLVWKITVLASTYLHMNISISTTASNLKTCTLHINPHFRLPRSQLILRLNNRNIYIMHTLAKKLQQCSSGSWKSNMVQDIFCFTTRVIGWARGARHHRQRGVRGERGGGCGGGLGGGGAQAQRGSGVQRGWAYQVQRGRRPERTREKRKESKREIEMTWHKASFTSRTERDVCTS